MRTIRDIFGRDLLHLAIILSLLKADVNRNNLLNARGLFGSYNEALVKQKDLLEDLQDLGSSDRWIRHQRPSDPVEISAYILNSLQDDSDVPLSSGGHEDADSGVSDVDTASTEGGRSPSASSVASTRTNYEFNEEEGQVVFPEPVLPESLHPEDPFFPLGESEMNLDDLELFESSMPELEDAEDDLSQLLAFEEPCSNLDVNLAATFAPDEEDVENQLMHIDDQLIRLNGSIDNINEGVDSLNGAIVAADDELDEDDSMMEALLGEDDQDFLFSSLQQPSLSPFDNWQVDANRDLDDLVNVGDVDQVAPASVTIKEEPKEETDPEPEKSIVIKQEVIEDDDQASYVDGATSQTYFESDESKLGIVKFEEFQPHLLDHTYAASPYDEELFDGVTVKVEQDEDYGANSTTSSPPYYLSSQYLMGASPQSMIRMRESRDERKARAFGLPFTCAELINSSMDRFNDLLSTSGLTESQIALCRDIRRRGKNKVAAQNCRRRKLDLISNLSEEIIRAREYKQQLLAEREHLYRMRNEWTNKLLNLEDQVLRGLDKNAEEYALELMPTTQQIRVTQRRLAKPARA